MCWSYKFNLQHNVKEWLAENIKRRKIKENFHIKIKRMLGEISSKGDMLELPIITKLILYNDRD